MPSDGDKKKKKTPKVARKKNEALDKYLERLMTAMYGRKVKPRGRVS